MEYVLMILIFVGFYQFNTIQANGLSQPMFYALDNPCEDKYRLCSTICDVITIKHDVNCQFCFCKNPDNEIVWETSTMQSSTKIHIASIISAEKSNHQSTGNIHTTKSPYLIVNSIKYVTLQNPCIPTLAVCPVRCLMSNVSYEGRICENCFCSKAIINSFPDPFGKRLIPFENKRKEPLLEDPLSAIKTEATINNMQKRTKHLHSQGSSSRPDTTELFCMARTGHCPGDCYQHNITVDNWHCHYCQCPPGVVFVAMVNPCRGRDHLCPTHCTVRNKTSDVIFASITCDYCDCRSNYKPDDLGAQRHQINSYRTEVVHRKFHCLHQSVDCPPDCQLIHVHGYHRRSCRICNCQKGLFI